MFIVFEGIDGCGKDTLISKLKQHLESTGSKVKVYSNIDNGALVDEIRAYLANGGISSYLLSFIVLANIVDTYRSIAKDIENGYTVLCSRWTMSSITYGGYKDESQFNKVYNVANSLDVTPDITFYLNVKPSIALTRIQKRGSTEERYDDIEKLTKISAKYNALLYEDTTKLSKYIYEIDANDTIYNVYNNIIRYIDITRDNVCI